MEKDQKLGPHIAIFLSTIFPGTGQIYNQQFVKAVFFLGVSFFFNLKANLNHSLIYAFRGDFDKADQLLNLPFALNYMSWFYIVMFEAYFSAYKLTHSQKPSPLNLIPFGTAVMVGDLGLIMCQLHIGLINLGLVFSLLGVGIGLIIRKIIMKRII